MKIVKIENSHIKTELELSKEEALSVIAYLAEQLMDYAPTIKLPIEYDD